MESVSSSVDFDKTIIFSYKMLTGKRGIFYSKTEGDITCKEALEQMIDEGILDKTKTYTNYRMVLCGEKIDYSKHLSDYNLYKETCVHIIQIN